MNPERVVGIDLGTTNTVVAESWLAAGATTRVLPIPQLVLAGSVGEESQLPSVLFVPTAGELASDPFGEAPFVVGVYARRRASEVPTRSITSPKSWLCHAGVDRLGAILPWTKDDVDPGFVRISPVDASRRILQRAAAAAFPERSFGEHAVVLTVPASFDEVARELTVRAAREAGLLVRLLEEPIAAFHDYLARSGTAALDERLLAGSDSAVVLVCDVGGGTTDLSLLRVTRDEGVLRFLRVAVGRHLLLGGDNMDLALAHSVESGWGLSEPLDPSRFAQLVLSCRDAKERLLGSAAPDSLPISVLGRGSALVGGTLSATLTATRVRELVLDGFFPEVEPGTKTAQARSALTGFGLPYERDPAITRHVAAFLERHPDVPRPSGVLFNGGVFRSSAVRERVALALSRLLGKTPFVLEGADPDHAVARGAAEYARSLAGFGPRIGGGSARGYYVGLDSRDGVRRALCIVPRGSEEGERHRVHVPGLTLVTGETVRFDLFATDDRMDAPGTVRDVDETLDALPSMTAAFATGTSSGKVPVGLEGELTGAGTLDVSCVEERSDSSSGAEPATRFRLAFDLRRAGKRRESVAPPSRRSSSRELDEATRLLARAFDGGEEARDGRLAQHALRDLERILGDRASWSTETARALFDALLPFARFRKRTASHERTFWLLAGFCGRPGYGWPADEKRVGKLVPLFNELVAHGAEARVWQQFFIAWRRLSGGLGEPAQVAMRDFLDAYLSTDPQKPKKKKGVRPLSEDEMLALAAALERVPAARRGDLGRWVLERTWTSRDPRLWGALGHIGARVPVYGSAHHVVATSTVVAWVDHLLREKWADVPTAPRAAMQLARYSGDRVRDLPETLRREVARRLEAQGAPAEWSRAVTELVPLATADRADFFGENLPQGLVLV